MKNLSRTVNIRCPQCGGEQFKGVEQATDSDFVQCATCNFEIILSDLKEHGVAEAASDLKADVIKQVRASFKGLFK